jgi:transposase
MNNKQNYKIMQITESTLVIGVDIAKKQHYARAFDWRGIELDKVFKFKANYTGFNNFIEWTKEVAKRANKDKVIVGIEPTGHYWYTFSQSVLYEGYILVQVNPYHVKRAKELDDNTPSKSDNKDPKTIAMLVKDGRYQIPYIPNGTYAELRKANNLREEWLKKILSVKNKVQRWLDIHFPELLTVFSSWEGKTAIMTLERMALPANIIELTAEEILSVWREEVKRGVGIKRAQELLEAAKDSVGIREGLEMAEYEIKLLIKEYKEIREILDNLEKKLESLVLRIPGAINILEIKGIGIKTVAGFFAEVGDITRFTHPKQIIKLAGLNVRENSSGEHKGKTTISKRGRSRLRAILFRAILPLTAKNSEFNALHKYNTIERENPLKKMQSLIALCCKLIRIIYTLVMKDVKYDPEKMLKDIRRDGLGNVA